MIIECTCSHEFQDQRYGHRMRVMNDTKTTKNERRKYRCTVCGREHEKGEAPKKDEPKEKGSK